MNLPESWAVANDGSKLFYNTVLKYLNEKFNTAYMGNQHIFYGIDGSSVVLGSTPHWTPNIFTIQEFINLTQPSPKTGDTVWVRDNNEINGQWVEKTFLSYSNNKKYPFIVCPTDRFETIESGISIMAQPFQELSTTDPTIVQEPEPVKMTVEEIEKELGKKIEIVSKTTTQ